MADSITHLAAEVGGVMLSKKNSTISISQAAQRSQISEV